MDMSRDVYVSGMRENLVNFGKSNRYVLIMYSSQKEALRRNHVSIMDQLDPKDVSDHLHQDGVLTESDHELIDTGKTRKERCWMLLGILPSRGPVAYNSFKNALKHGYSHLEKLLSETTSSNGKVKDTCLDSPYHFGSIGICAKCQPYMPANIASPALQNVLHKSCCMILQNVEASDLLDLLYQEAILERNDCELIKSEKTRKDRCVVLISKLSQCAKSYVSTVFTESLRRKYSFITDMLDNVNKEVSEGSLHLRSSPINDERSSYPTHHTGIHRVLEVKPTEWFYQNHSVQKSNVLTNSTEEVNNNFKELNFKGKTQLDRTRSVQTRFWQSKCSHSKCRVLSSYSMVHQPDTCLAICLENQENVKVIGKHGTRIHRKRHRNQSSSYKTSKYIHLDTSHCQLLKQSFELRGNGQETVFNYLSTLINQGSYKEFEACAVNIRHSQGSNVDMMCILDYLFASRFLHTADVYSAKTYIKSGLKLAQKTQYPKYFTLELFTCQTRMLIIKKKLGKLQNVLDDAKMIIEADPTCCTGRAAGWLYMNDVKNIMVQISMLNTYRSNYPLVYEHLYKHAKDSCQKSLDHFKRDQGKDGPFGIGFALCRLIILLLRCGDKGLYNECITPDQENVELAGKHLHQLEDSDIPITAFLKVPLLLAKSDYYYRREHIQRALEYAQEAFQLTENNSILEYKEQAQNRVCFLAAKLDAEGK